MQVNLNQLRSFYLAVKHNSISKAAQELFVTPPAITMQIKKLEEWLGFGLICRRKNGIKLAEGAQDFYEQAKKIFAEVDIMEHQIDLMVKKEKQELRIGSHYIPAKYIMPQLMARIHQLFPKLNVKVVLDSVPGLMERIKNHDLHFWLAGVPNLGPQFRKLPLFKEDMVLVSARDSKYIKKQPITMDDIKRLPLLLPEQGTAASEIIHAYLDNAGINPCIEMDNLSADIVKEFVFQDVGLAFLARFAVRDKLETGKLQEIKIVGGPPVTEFSLIYNHGKPLIPLVEKLSASLKKIPFNLYPLDKQIEVPSSRS